MIEAMRDPSVTAIPREDGAEWDYVADFDWAGYFLKNSVHQNHNVSISGGGERSEYYVSASWLDQNGYFSGYGPDNFDRYNLRLNMANELVPERSEEHTSELQSLMRISYAVFCLKKKKPPTTHT